MLLVARPSFACVQIISYFNINTFLQPAAMLPQRGRVCFLLGIFLVTLLMGALCWSRAGEVVKKARFDTKLQIMQEI